MAWSAAFEKVAGVVQQVLGRLWGTQTRANAQAEEEIDEQEHAFDKALQRGDLAAANAAIDQLRRLRDKAAARSKPD